MCYMYSCNYGFYYPVIRNPCCNSRFLWGVLAWFLQSDTLELNISHQMAAGILTTMVPIVSNSLFSLSMEKGYLGGYMVYVVFLCTAVVALCGSSLLPRCDTKSGENRPIELEMSTRPPTTWSSFMVSFHLVTYVIGLLYLIKSSTIVEYLPARELSKI